MSEQITTPEALDVLPDHNVLLLASGAYPGDGGTFRDCWLRPIPEHITGVGSRTWEVLTYGMSWPENLVSTEDIALPVTVLFRPDAPTPTRRAGDGQREALARVCEVLDGAALQHMQDGGNAQDATVTVGEIERAMDVTR